MWKRFRNSMEWKYLSNIGLEHISEHIYCTNYKISDCYQPLRLVLFHNFWFSIQEYSILWYVRYHLRVLENQLRQIVTCLPSTPWHLTHYFPQPISVGVFRRRKLLCVSVTQTYPKLNLYCRAYINLCKYVFHTFYCAIQFSLA